MAVLVENNVLLVLACLVVLLSEIAAPTSKHCAYIVFPALISPYTLTKYENTLVNLPFRLETDNGKCTHNASENIVIYVFQPEKSAPFCTVVFRKGNCRRVTFGKEKCRCDKLVSNGAILKQCVTLADHGVWNWNSGDTTVRKEIVSFDVRSGAPGGLTGRGENCTTTEGNVSIGNNNDNTRDHHDDEDDGGSLVTFLILAVLGLNVVTIIVVVVVSAYRGKFSRKRKSRRTAGSIEDNSSRHYEEIPELPIDQQQHLSLIPASHVEDNPMLLQRDVVVPIHADLPPLLVPVQDRLLPQIPDAAVVVHSIFPQPRSLSETPTSPMSPEMPDAGVWLPSIYPHRTPLRNSVPDTHLSAAYFGARRHPDPNRPEEIEMSVLGKTHSHRNAYARAKDTIEDDDDDFYTLLGTGLLYRRQELHLRSVLGDVEKSPDESCVEMDYYLELIPDDVPNSSHSQDNCHKASYDIPRNPARPQNDDDYLHPVSCVLPTRSQSQNNDDYLHPIFDVLSSLQTPNDDDYLHPISDVLPSLRRQNDDDCLHPISDVLPSLRPQNDD